MTIQRCTFPTPASMVERLFNGAGAGAISSTTSVPASAVGSLPPRPIIGTSPVQAGARQLARGCFKTFVVILAISLPACSTVENKHTVKVTAQSILADQRRHDAELREEAFGPRMAASDYRRMLAAESAIRNREQKELAMYAKFQMDRRVALAQASSPKLLITNGSDIPVDYRQLDRAAARDYRNLAYTPASSRVSRSYAGQGSDYPARFYKRELQENSASQAVAEYNENARVSQQQSQDQSDADTPYAVPVPGRPGFVTMPPKMGGYIDVRGYAPGSYVMDPWTKTVIRVP